MLMWKSTDAQGFFERSILYHDQVTFSLKPASKTQPYTLLVYDRHELIKNCSLRKSKARTKAKHHVQVFA